MGLEGTLRREKSQPPKAVYSQTHKIIEMENKLVVAKDWGW